ncbi:MAG: hypothetical protein JSR64_09400 [Nitrospira sp.]|nr:hypothetical protein [Nitrospira sp.]
MTSHRKQRLQAETERLLAGKRVSQVSIAAKLNGDAAESWSQLRSLGDHLEFSQADLLALLIGACHRDLLQVLQAAAEDGKSQRPVAHTIPSV